MAYCSNCGKKLTGALRFCSSCGYKISESEMEQIIDVSDRSKNNSENVKFAEVEMIDDTEEEDENDEETREAEIVDRPNFRTSQIPPGTKVKEKIPKSTRCSVCGMKTDDMCFFCEWAVCKKHQVTMEIESDTGRFGNTVSSCPDCAERKSGRQPTDEEAAEVGFFFKIKPYHEWKIIK